MFNPPVYLNAEQNKIESMQIKQKMGSTMSYVLTLTTTNESACAWKHNVFPVLLIPLQILLIVVGFALAAQSPIPMFLRLLNT